MCHRFCCLCCCCCCCLQFNVAVSVVCRWFWVLKPRPHSFVMSRQFIDQINSAECALYCLLQMESISFSFFFAQLKQKHIAISLYAIECYFVQQCETWKILFVFILVFNFLFHRLCVVVRLDTERTISKNAPKNLNKRMESALFVLFQVANVEMVRC